MADIFQIALEYVHILGVMIWIGGGIYFLRIVQPNLAGLPPDQAGRLAGAMVKKFTPVAWASIIALGVAGALKAYMMGMFDTGLLMGTAFGNMLILKMVLYAVMVTVGITIGKTSASIPTLQPQEIPKTQARIKTLAEANIVLGLITILVAVA